MFIKAMNDFTVVALILTIIFTPTVLTGCCEEEKPIYIQTKIIDGGLTERRSNYFICEDENGFAYVRFGATYPIGTKRMISLTNEEKEAYIAYNTKHTRQVECYECRLRREALEQAMKGEN